MNERNDLDFGALKGPAKTKPRVVETEGQGAAVEQWPSRSPVTAPMDPVEAQSKPKVSLEAQVSIRGPHEIIERFKGSCQIGRARLSYYDKIAGLLDIEDKLLELEIGGRNAEPMDILLELIDRSR